MDKDVEELLHTLDYAHSENCLRGDAMAYAQDYGHIFRRAHNVEGKLDLPSGAGLQAVYCIQQDSRSNSEGKSPELIPVTYVCRANSIEDADRLHRLIWNQNVVPFAVVLTPKDVRLYSGFTSHQQKGSNQAYIAAEQDMRRVAEVLRVTAGDIDSGLVWRHYAEHIQPRKRVEWRLLENLKKLEAWLVTEGVDDSNLVHALIGKFVYLYYLRHRNILSDERLNKGNLSWSVMRGDQLTLAGFSSLLNYVEQFLNGTIFPLDSSDLKRIGRSVVRKVANLFSGDDTSGQRHLSFNEYDFSYIPIETLSVIYEQFLHSKKADDGESQGRDSGAYYTPVPLVNFMVDRMDELHPLKEGTRVLDPACGSGAFLVQCYRRLLESKCRAERTQKLHPTELRRILVEHIHGIDIDSEACRVAELSLNLTLLDYTNPPDLTSTTFKLPKLMGKNIIKGDAFPDTTDSSGVSEALAKWSKRGKFDWIIGNPPWKVLKGNGSAAMKWVGEDPRERPIGRNQLAEAFALRSIDFAGNEALTGLLMPASTLFKDHSTGFRRKLFTQNALAYVANFSNLAEYLFAGRSTVPAAAVIFRPGQPVDEQMFPVYSPLVANQELTRPVESRNRVDTWNFVINEGEVREVSAGRVATGDGVIWKLAAWGCHIDERILRKLSRMPSFGTFLKTHGLHTSQGLELRADLGKEPLEHHPELLSRDALITEELRGEGRLFAFPKKAIGVNNRAYVRQGRFNLPESICRPPHVILSAARNWAVFEDRYIVVPPRQIGIAGSSDQIVLLKALALYLNSDIAQYEQFFSSPQMGVQMKRSTLRALRTLPVPQALSDADNSDIHSWAKLYDKLAELDRNRNKSTTVKGYDKKRARLLREMNESVGQAVGLQQTELIRVDEFVNVIEGLRDGKVEERAVRKPDEPEVKAYGEILKLELDTFTFDESAAKDGYDVDIFLGDTQGVIRVAVGSNRSGVNIDSNGTAAQRVINQSKKIQKELQARCSQWRYFNRSLRLFADDAVYLFKPMQRFHWLRSQAVVDATELIGLAIEHAGVSE